MARPQLAVVAGCTHCGLAVPAGRESFCCAGCEIVYQAIERHQLGTFYALRDARDAVPARTTRRDYGELDDPAFHRIHVQRGESRARVALYLEDLRCTACVWLVEAAASCVPGIVEVRVDLGRSRADVTWDPERCTLSRIARHFDRIGHPVHPYRGLDRDDQRRREDRALLAKLGVAGAAVGNLMLLAIALYAGMFGGMNRADTTFFRVASMIVAVPALGYAATPMFRTALGALRARRLHLDLPLSIGIIAGLGWGSANVLRGVGEIYFDSLAMLVFLLLVARWIVLRHQRRAASAAELLLALAPSRARRITAGVEHEVPIEALGLGDRIAVRAGETIPVDGTVASGRSTVDAGLLTGESRPIEVGEGAHVHAGTINLAGPIEIMVEATGESTRVGALVATMEALSTRKAPIERFVDRVAGRFVAVVTTAAAITVIAWSTVSVAAGAEHAMALLVVTCPCALALATPLAVTVALGRAARRGILIKGADALERLATPGTMFLDKTGTLTEGKLAVASWRGDLDAAPLAAAAEAGSDHPIARALGRHAVAACPATDVREELGRGISAFVGTRRVHVGSPAWVRERATVAPGIERWIAELADRAETPVVIAIDNHAVAVAGLADPIRPDASHAIARLRGLGWHISLLSGDEPRVVARVGDALGIPVTARRGGVSPEGKVAAVTAARDSGPVVMVGDGVNDAAAMAAATTSIAVSGAADIAIEAADVYLREPSITAIADAAHGGSETLATIRRSLYFSLAYNIVAGLLAATGIIHPLLAALLMPLSSLAVLASSLRSRAFRKS
ncbi:MAG TPA: heavy metal translocating P-type ATPase [Kofleriaceae bacterium]